MASGRRRSIRRCWKFLITVSLDKWGLRPDDPTESISFIDCDRSVLQIICWETHCIYLRQRTIRGMAAD